MPCGLKGRNVLIKSGLGAVIANAFAAEGCNIAINYASCEDPAVELQDRTAVLRYKRDELTLGF